MGMNTDRGACIETDMDIDTDPDGTNESGYRQKDGYKEEIDIHMDTHTNIETDVWIHNYNTFNDNAARDDEYECAATVCSYRYKCTSI